MLILVLSGFFMLFAGLCYARHRVLKVREGQEKNAYDAWAVLFTAITFISLFFGFWNSGTEGAQQISDFENIEKFRQIEVINKDKAGVLTDEFSKHLAETYPEHERYIYDKISPGTVNLYLVKYPELQASGTLVTLVDLINKLQSDVYDQQINVVETLKNIRYRSRNPWLFQFMIPKMQTDEAVNPLS